MPAIRALLCGLIVLLAACVPLPGAPGGHDRYFDHTGRDDVLTGGVRMIPIDTPAGRFRVWTKRVGNNPRIKLLILHGGPGFTHEAYEAFDSYLPPAGIEYYYYDQLGSAYSDQPHDKRLWQLDRFVDEVEQVRKALNLTPDNFYLYGHSWGGLLAIEYALQHPGRLRGLIVSNMMSSVPAYNDYATKVLMPQMDPAVLAEIKAIEARKDYQNPRYMALLNDHHYVHHILRRPLADWPEPVLRSTRNMNSEVYIPMQGPSELGSVDALLANWDRSADLKKITVPTLVIGARYDTMDPRHMEWMAGQFPQGRFLLCPDGSHFALYDDQRVYIDGLLEFLRDVDAHPSGGAH